MPSGDLMERVRAAVTGGGVDPATYGLIRLLGGMSHDVFAPIDDPSLVVKVFQVTAGEEPEREWDALVALASSGIAPEPVHYDGRDPAIILMTRVPGSSLSAAELGAEHARLIGNIHRLVHRTLPESRRPLAHSGVRAAHASLMLDEWPTESNGHKASDVVTRAWTAARRWIATADVELALSSEPLCFTRGDPNLTNYLWSDGHLVLVDWENSGYGDPVLELADIAEHASTRALSQDCWTDLADATDLSQTDRARVGHTRRLMACFWLVLIDSRQRDGLPTTVSLDEQAHRTLAVLGC